MESIVRRMSEKRIRSIFSALKRAYHSPRHGNRDNPLDELIYIVLSTRTQETAYQHAYACLKQTFRSWSRIAPSSISEVRRILRPIGLGNLKAGQLAQILKRLSEDFGRATLAPLKRMTNTEAEEYLVSLPGVGRKIAKCVMMYSLNRQVLPVDVHVHRVAHRLGFRVKRRPDTSQQLLEDAVQPRWRYGFHVNAVAHGRAVCRPNGPRCSICCLTMWCEYYSANRMGRSAQRNDRAEAKPLSR